MARGRRWRSGKGAIRHVHVLLLLLHLVINSRSEGLEKHVLSLLGMIDRLFGQVNVLSNGGHTVIRLGLGANVDEGSLLLLKVVHLHVHHGFKGIVHLMEHIVKVIVRNRTEAHWNDNVLEMTAVLMVVVVEILAVLLVPWSVIATALMVTLSALIVMMLHRRHMEFISRKIAILCQDLGNVADFVGTLLDDRIVKHEYHEAEAAVDESRFGNTRTAL